MQLVMGFLFFILRMSAEKGRGGGGAPAVPSLGWLELRVA
jgi:hypothetical protein